MRARRLTGYISGCRQPAVGHTIFTGTGERGSGAWKGSGTNMTPRFAHLHLHSFFSMRDGAARISDIISTAVRLNMPSIALTDHNGLYGAINFYSTAREAGIKPIIGCELADRAGYHLTLLARDINGYSNLCRLVTESHLCGNGHPAFDIEMLADCSPGIIALSGCRKGEVASLISERKHGKALRTACKYADIFSKDNFFIELQNHLLPEDSEITSRLLDTARAAGLSAVATNNVHYIEPDDYFLHEVVACVGERTSVSRHRLRENAEYYLKSPLEMAKIFRSCPGAIETAVDIAEMCDLDLGLGSIRLPAFPVQGEQSPDDHLRKLCLDGVKYRYVNISDEVSKRLEHELSVIRSMNLSNYFLIVWDIVSYAKERGIRYSGRGSAADSLVCYLLGITNVDPIANDLLFERFLNPNRRDLPDIDIDFDSNRRDEVISYILKRFGRDRTAMVCTVNKLAARGSIRDIAKALDFEKDEIDNLAKPLPPFVSAEKLSDLIKSTPELDLLRRKDKTTGNLFSVCEKLTAYPRYLSIHLGGVAISSGRMTDLVPLQRSANGVIITQFDKDDIEALGLVKMDVLGLRALSAIQGALDMLAKDGTEIDLDSVSLEDEKVYQLLCTGKTIGVFQLESPGMRELLGRLQPSCFTDIVAAISLFRPGPIQGNMVEPYIKRRHGLEDVVYDHPILEPILKETYGVILYQEQVIQVASALAGFTPGQADMLRRAMTHRSSIKEMESLRKDFIAGAIKNGVIEEIAGGVFSKLSSFAYYGFNKAHAAAFARISYESAYLKAHYPAHYLASILNCEPMGFFPAWVILNEARRMGITILPTDINESSALFSARDNAIKVGLMQVAEIGPALLEKIESEKAKKCFDSIDDFKNRVRPPVQALENLVKIGAFDSFHPNRRNLLRNIFTSDLTTNNSPMRSKFFSDSFASRERVAPADYSLTDKVAMESRILGISLSAHPISPVRRRLRSIGVSTASELESKPDGTRVRVAGIVVHRSSLRAKNGKHVLFLTLEDETGIADLTVFSNVLTKSRRACFRSSAIVASGRISKRGKTGFSITATCIEPLDLR